MGVADNGDERPQRPMLTRCIAREDEAYIHEYAYFVSLRTDTGVASYATSKRVEAEEIRCSKDSSSQLWH
jgi:hypothetical protein